MPFTGYIMDVQDRFLSLTIMYCYMKKVRSRSVPKIRDKTSCLPGFAYTLELLDSSSTQCEDIMRLSRVAYIQLCNNFKQRGWLKDSRYSTIVENIFFML